MAKNTYKLTRKSGSRREAIPGIGFTILGEEFTVPTKELYDALETQEGRFEKTSSKGTDTEKVDDIGEVI